MNYTESQTHKDAPSDVGAPAIDCQYLGYFGHGKRLVPTAIVIHHTCTASPERTRKTLKKNGYSTHFEVGRDGHIFQYMPTNEQASHCGSSNCHCIGIDVTHLKDAPWTSEQIASVKSLVRYLCQQLHIPQTVHEQLSGIYPHKALGCTECPQDFPMSELEA